MPPPDRFPSVQILKFQLLKDPEQSSGEHPDGKKSKSLNLEQGLEK